ncbi:MAG: adenylyltransferase/cytidyltransferase family protein [Candidatus Berkiella sp.]
MQRIGVMGASFNPPTRGHASVISQAYPEFDEILLVPSVLHAFQKKLIPISHRLAMLQLFIEHELKDNEKKHVTILNIEPTLLTSHPERPFVYTFDVLSAIEQEYQRKSQPVSLRFIVGPDLAEKSVWQRFYRYQEIEQRWPLYVVAKQKAINSTMVRELIRNALEEKMNKEKLVEWVGEPIATYILHHGLYRENEVQND